jgi:hypothetical protein
VLAKRGYDEVGKPVTTAPMNAASSNKPITKIFPSGRATSSCRRGTAETPNVSFAA